MSIRTLLLLIVGAAIAFLAALNWPALSAVQPISLGFTTLQGPLGLILIGLTVLLAAVFLVYIFYMHSTVLFETRRHTKELQSQRELADKAEASRFTELRAFLEGLREDGVARDQATQQVLLGRLDQSDNSAAAYFGEISDRLDRVVGRPEAGAPAPAAAADLAPVSPPADTLGQDSAGPRVF